MKLRQIIKSLRKFRVWHRLTGLILAIIVIISALTGILLALKKDIDTLQPPTQKGVSKDLSTWKSIAELSEIATLEFHKTHPAETENKIDKIDVRPSKGIAKVLFKKGYWEVQIDGSSGEVLSIKRRHSDWIEQLHDGSIISDGFKLVSMNTLGFGLLFMTITGIWLWYGPRRIRALKKK